MEQSYELTYWSNKGKHQAAYDLLNGALVPAEGEADTVAGQIVRLVGNVYYERFNNGGSFTGGQRAEDGRELKRLARFTTPGKDDEPAWDLMVDRCLEQAMEKALAEPATAARLVAYLQAKATEKDRALVSAAYKLTHAASWAPKRRSMGHKPKRDYYLAAANCLQVAGKDTEADTYIQKAREAR